MGDEEAAGGALLSVPRDTNFVEFDKEEDIFGKKATISYPGSNTLPFEAYFVNTPKEG